MTARPGRIKADVPIDLPYPRHYTVKTSPEFSALKARLTEEIRAEAVLAAEGIDQNLNAKGLRDPVKFCKPGEYHPRRCS